jgi:acetoin utilization deacetylase AcuC-like enzyme
MKYVYSEKHLLHDPEVEIEASGLNSPRERPGRLIEIKQALDSDSRFEFVEPTPHGLDPIKQVHDPAMVDFLASAWQRFQTEVRPSREVVPDVFAMGALRDGMPSAKPPTPVDAQLGWYCFETTTPLVAGSFEAACAAVDVALTATDLVLAHLADTGQPLTVYAACRPPGHHAGANIFGGYCFFNNVAIAAEYSKRRTTIIDIDYHHGNGTQQIFYHRPDVQFISLHADPTRAYPFHLGFADETGSSTASGTTLNVPLGVGVTDQEFLSAMSQAIDSIKEFQPEVLFVSLGFDIAATDPLGDFSITSAGLTEIAHMIKSLKLPTVIVQEGGYDVSRLGSYALAFLQPFVD